MNNSFNQLSANINHRSPADGGGGVRCHTQSNSSVCRTPADGGGGVRCHTLSNIGDCRMPADGGGGVR